MNAVLNDLIKTSKLMCKRTSLFLLIIMCGCSLLRSYDEKTFSFNYDGDDYEIVSKVQGDEVLENLLLMFDQNGEIIFEGVDEDSDGELDKLLKSEISLFDANRIYYAGIEQALESGNLNSKNEVRIYEFIDPPYTYTIETIGYDDYSSRRRMVYGYLKEVVVYNQFRVYQPEEGTEIILQDMDADGVLDSVVAPDDITLFEYQDRYRDVLDEGLRSGRIMMRDRMYIVTS